LEGNWILKFSGRQVAVKHFVMKLFDNFLHCIGEENTLYGSYLHRHYSVSLVRMRIEKEELEDYIKNIQESRKKRRESETAQVLLQNFQTVNEHQYLDKKIKNRTALKNSISECNSKANGNNTESSNESLHIAARRNLERMGYKTWEA
jgi:hypothetical protein